MPRGSKNGKTDEEFKLVFDFPLLWEIFNLNIPRSVVFSHALIITE